MDKKVLTSGYRVVWQTGAVGSPHKASIRFATIEEAENFAESIREGGDRVVRIERKGEVQS